MALCAVSYPTIRPTDLEWIQSFRRRHDRLFFDLIAPHFSLVFPTKGLSESDLIAHLKQILADVPPFDFVIRCAILGDPDFMEHAHAFLVPDEGFSHLVRLHALLYTGPLASELRLDLPFIPHVGVASTRTAEECKALVDKLNDAQLEIHGRVESLEVIGYDGKRVWSIEDCPLGPGRIGEAIKS